MASASERHVRSPAFLSPASCTSRALCRTYNTRHAACSGRNTSNVNTTAAPARDVLFLVKPFREERVSRDFKRRCVRSRRDALGDFRGTKPFRTRRSPRSAHRFPRDASRLPRGSRRSRRASLEIRRRPNRRRRRRERRLASHTRRPPPLRPRRARRARANARPRRPGSSHPRDSSRGSAPEPGAEPAGGARTAAHVAGKCLAAAALGLTSDASHRGRCESRPPRGGSRDRPTDRPTTLRVFVSGVRRHPASARAERPRRGNRVARRASLLLRARERRDKAASSARASGTLFSNPTRQSLEETRASAIVSSKGRRRRFAWKARRERRERLERGPAARLAPKRKRGDGARRLQHPDDAEFPRERDVRVQRERAPRDQEREPLEGVAELCFAVRFATHASGSRGLGFREGNEA